MNDEMREEASRRLLAEMDKAGSRIKQRRRQLGLTQTALSKKIGENQSSVSLLERGQPLLDLKKLSIALDIHPLALLADLPTEACELVDQLASLAPRQRYTAMRIFRVALDLADAVSTWEVRSK